MTEAIVFAFMFIVSLSVSVSLLVGAIRRLAS